MSDFWAPKNLMLARCLLPIACILLLFVSLSTPVIKSNYILKLAADESLLGTAEATGSVSLGVWGYCIGATDVGAFGYDHVTAGECTRQLGYSFDSKFADALHVDGFVNLVSESLTGALVLHVIDCVLTILVTIVLLMITFQSGNMVDQQRDIRLGLFLDKVEWVLIPTTMLTIITFCIDAGLMHTVSKAAHKVDIHVIPGSAYWLTLTSMLLLIVSSAAILYSWWAFYKGKGELVSRPLKF